MFYTCAISYPVPLNVFGIRYILWQDHDPLSQANKVFWSAVMHACPLYTALLLVGDGNLIPKTTVATGKHSLKVLPCHSLTSSLT